MKQKKLALSLRGGGARVLGYLGMFDLFSEKGIRIDGLITSSAGSIVGGSMAFGITSKQILEHFSKWNRKKYFNFDAIKEFSLASDDKSIEYAKELIGEKDLSEADIPIYIQTTNLTENRKEIFTAGPAAQICIASAALPLAYHPIEIGDSKYIDSDVIPSNGVSYMKDLGYEVVIELKNHTEISNSTPLKYIELLMHRIGELESKHEPSDYSLAYDATDIGILDFKSASEQLYQRGYAKAEESLEEIKKLILI